MGALDLRAAELVSLIVPVYMVEEYLDRCVESLINQTYTNIEIILVDDGSPDNSGQVAEAWREKDSRVRVFHKENNGPSSARNFGLRQARGAYIGFVDSDDCVDEHYVESLYIILKEYGADVAAIGHMKFSGSTVPERTDFHLSETELFSRSEALENLFAPDKYLDFAWNKLFSRELFDGIEFPEGRLMEDLGTMYRLLDRCGSMAFNPAKLYFYYQRNNSILGRKKNITFMRDKYTMIKERYIYLKENYPSIYMNHVSFFSGCLLVYAFQDESERQWAVKELKMLWPRVRESVTVRDRIKYYCSVSVNAFFCMLCRVKMQFTGEKQK